MDYSLFSGSMDKLAGKNAYRDMVFICPQQNGDQTGFTRQNASLCGLDLEMLPFGSMDEAETEARHMVFSLNDPKSMPAGALKICALKGLYIQDHYQDIKNGMSEHRWQHTLGVRRSAVALAEKYGGSLIKCAVAAFYHDCAKDMNPKDMRKVLLDHGTDSRDEILHSGAMMHGPAGAILAEEKYHVYDREVLDAIRYHTTGREEMTLTDLIIFVADAIEPNRQDYPGLNVIRTLADIDLYAAALYSLYMTRDYVFERGKIFHLAGQKTITALEDRLRNDRNLDRAAVELLREKSSVFN
ncbi:MAG: bis(5'-nucleosyl)-tetraphosphatase (symmetrical) YqeK [Clostridia bacterium]|nr:bis(5'-nucleosyl)-tetraphosphatase (symmetrical) YqeK [Clostridia bacterium]